MINWEDLPFNSDLYIEGLETVEALGLETIGGSDSVYNDQVYGFQDHRRKVWKEVSTGLIKKIWRQEYIRGEYFHDAYKRRFYDGLAPSLVNVIMDEQGVCRAYVMNNCTKLTHDERRQERWLDRFLPLLIERVKSTGYFYHDFHPDNIMKYGEKLCLIDLDAIYPFSDYEIWQHKHQGGALIKIARYKAELDRLAQEWETPRVAPYSPTNEDIR